MKLIKTEEAVGHVLCHDMTQIIKDEYKDARFRKGHVVTEEDIPVLLALVMALSLVACGNKTDDTQKTDDQTPAETVELTVFAAASLTESLTAIGEKYMAENENVKISFNFDSSGKLYTQITEGAPCDLFISAAPKQMNQLDGTLKDDADKNPGGLDMLVEGSRIDLLENKVALAVAEGSDKGIDSFDKLAELLKSGDVMMAIGNSDVPVGQYTQKIFAYYEIDEAAAAFLAYLQGADALCPPTRFSGGLPHGLVSPLKLAAHRRDLGGGGVLCGHRRGVLYHQAPASGQRHSGRDPDAAPGPAAYGGGLSAAAVSSISCGCRR